MKTKQNETMNKSIKYRKQPNQLNYYYHSFNHTYLLLKNYFPLLSEVKNSLSFISFLFLLR
jgi:hypothetical protein